MCMIKKKQLTQNYSKQKKKIREKAHARKKKK